MDLKDGFAINDQINLQLIFLMIMILKITGSVVMEKGQKLTQEGMGGIVIN